MQNRQACMVEVEDGMTVLSQKGAPAILGLEASEEGMVP
ncbi:2Fe-2S iron-sulfur cluster-binding family protein [Sinorhizobium meliloti]|nr:hypothetical protein [Sinorhizobium meliloti]